MTFTPNQVQANAARCASLAAEICQVPAPTGHEERRAEFMARQLARFGWEVSRDSVGNVIALPVGARQRAQSPLVVAAHLDTVFPNIRNIRVRREGDVMFGPGIADNSLGLAGLCSLAETFAGKQSARDLALVATVGEEGLGNLRGALHCVEQLRPVEFVALEGGGLSSVVLRGVGSLRLRLVIRGPGGHSWQDRGAPSAAHALTEMLSRLQKARPEQIGESFNIGKLRGGTSISVIAQRAVADIEFRSVHQVRLHRAAQFIRQEIGRLDPRLAVISTVLGERPAGSTSAKHPLVQDAVATRLEADLPRPELVTSSTDANAAMARSVPAISVSLADSDAVHTPEESVDLSRLPQGLLALNLLVSARLRYRATA